MRRHGESHLTQCLYRMAFLFRGHLCWNDRCRLQTSAARAVLCIREVIAFPIKDGWNFREYILFKFN